MIRIKDQYTVLHLELASQLSVAVALLVYFSTTGWFLNEDQVSGHFSVLMTAPSTRLWAVRIFDTAVLGKVINEPFLFTRTHTLIVRSLRRVDSLPTLRNTDPSPIGKFEAIS